MSEEETGSHRSKAHGGHSETVDARTPRGEASGETSPADTLTSDLPPPTERSTLLVCNPPSLWCSVPGVLGDFPVPNFLRVTDTVAEGPFLTQCRQGRTVGHLGQTFYALFFCAATPVRPAQGVSVRPPPQAPAPTLTLAVTRLPQYRECMSPHRGPTVSRYQVTIPSPSAAQQKPLLFQAQMLTHWGSGSIHTHTLPGTSFC